MILTTSAHSGYYFREAETTSEGGNTASNSDESNGEDPSEWEVGHVRGNTAGESTKSPDSELDREANDGDINPFEDMLDYAPMPVDGQVRSL